MHGWMSIRMRRCTDRRRRGACGRAPRANSFWEGKFLLGGQIPSSAEGKCSKAFRADSIWIPRLPPWGIQRRSERKFRKKVKMESEKKTNGYYKNTHRIQSFIILPVQANLKKKVLAGFFNPFCMKFSTFFLRPAFARASCETFEPRSGSLSNWRRA